MKMKLRLLLFAVLIISTFQNVYAQGGMWLPNLLEGINEQEMQDLGMKLEASDIYDINNSSIKDAIVQFGGGCTAEIISDQGLLLTNHHCGYGRIQAHSSLENNLLKNGFWAADMTGELPNPGLTVTMIDQIEDVSEQVLEGTDMLTDSKEIQSKIDQNIQSIKNATIVNEYQGIIIRPFYYGNKYYMFITTVFEDIRLVGAPPESIGKFGADTDNWVFPRHNADFALFRIYVNKDNEPAKYSEDNVPYKPKHHLPISMDGVEEGDFTLVFGFPGRTREYLPAVAIEQIVEVINPGKIAVRDASLKVMDKYMRADEATRLQYASKFAGIANYWKKWIGESQGLKKTNAVGEKKKIEDEFMARLEKNPAQKEQYGQLLSQFDALYNEIEPYAFAEGYAYEVLFRNNELLRVLGYFDRLIRYYEENGETGYTNYKNRLLPYLNGLFNNYRSEIDKEVFTVLAGMYKEDMEDRFIPSVLKSEQTPGQIAENIYTGSSITDINQIEQILNMEDIPAAIEKIKNDPAYQLSKQWRNIFDEAITPEYNRIMAEINIVQKEYMKALIEVFPEKRFFPDANSTLRLTYGQVNGYEPRDAVYYQPSTYLSGVIEKYVPGDYEFDLPQKLIDLHESGDFGAYADESGDVPVCFIGTNHTTGGNSGSPALDAHGNLIGLNFDRVWEGTMSDLYYDPSICRNIMVDARFILFIIDKFAGATHLIEEMDIVYPKKNK